MEAVRTATEMNVEVKGERRRPKKRLLDKTENDTKATGECVGDVEYRNRWKFRIRETNTK